ncbi:hypothetical protein G3T14_05370 [Methylobacterium sp. BTF04]|uniref:hypothetical protein n=1 Tax=Methylobacterium sp. BTF04 TaxID=2708300 RepID=UPI0013D4A037|nr:hypothetical protein [Methylobacterium sp. BTF04]NEU11556.1 hypothetical protein [Methylobacterium sp. BTF04]
MIIDKCHNIVSTHEIKNGNPEIDSLFPNVTINNLSVTDSLMILSEAIRVVEFGLSYNVRDADENLLMRKKDWFGRVLDVMLKSQDTNDGCFSVGAEHRLALCYARQELNDYLEDIDAVYARLTQIISVM